MNNFKSCVPCVCTGSGHKRVCEKHDNKNKYYCFYSNESEVEEECAITFIIRRKVRLSFQKDNAHSSKRKM